MRKKLVMILVLLAYILVPTNLAFCQTEERDDFGWNDHFYASLIDIKLSNVKTADALISLRTSFNEQMVVVIEDYNKQVSNNQKGARELADLIELQTLILDHLDARIKIAEKDERIFNIVSTGFIHQTVTDGADSVDPHHPPEPNPIVTNYQSIRANDNESSALHGLNAAVVNKVPDSSDVMQTASATNYDFDAGISPSSSSVIVQQDNEPAETSPTTAPSVNPIFPDSAPQNEGNNITINKPVRFTNNGIYAATVVVAGYTPSPNTFAQSINASTVVFPGGNSSGQLSLPIGEYSFCYYWDLGEDLDNDGYVDYAHATTGTITLSENSPDNVNNAQVVSLHPEKKSSANGKCGEDIQPQAPSDSTLELTPQELINQGTHTYQCTGNYDFNEAIPVRVVFSTDGVSITVEGVTSFFNKILPNRYQITEDGWLYEVIFKDSGITYIFDGYVVECNR